MRSSSGSAAWLQWRKPLHCAGCSGPLELGLTGGVLQNDLRENSKGRVSPCAFSATNASYPASRCEPLNALKEAQRLQTAVGIRAPPHHEGRGWRFPSSATFMCGWKDGLIYIAMRRSRQYQWYNTESKRTAHPPYTDIYPRDYGK